MRRDNRPYWLKQVMDAMNQFMVDRFLVPQFDSVGTDFKVMNPRHLQLSGPNIHVGDHVYVTALYDSPVRLAVFDGLGRIDVGSYSIINPGVRITSADSIVIGESCLLAMNAYLADADWHGLQHRIFAPGNTAPITLKDNVWIGDGAFVGKGVTIGENSIVCAFAVVTKDVPDNVIVAGCPARVIREFDNDDFIARKALFTGEVPYADFDREYQIQSLAGNTFAGWLKSVVSPGRTN